MRTILLGVAIAFTSASAWPQNSQDEQSLFGLPVHFSVGGNAGYGMVDMQEINAAIRETGTIRQAVNSKGEAADLLNGGFYWDAMVMARMNRVLFGLGFSSLSTSGESTFQQGYYLSDQLSGTASELFALVGLRIPSDGALYLDLLAGGGLAMASMDYRGEYRSNTNPADNLLVSHNLEGSVFSARVLATAGAVISTVRIALTAGYRFANAEVLKGKVTVNGQTSADDQPFVDFRGNEIGWDFSGLVLGAGVFVEF